MGPVAIVAACLALLAAGCGSGDEETPAACLGGAVPYLEALPAAPDEVRLRGEVAISSCLVDNQPAGELARLGTGLVEATTTLNARAQGSARQAIQLGYLVGAVRKGAAETSGIHADLVRRIEAAAELSPGGRPSSPAFEAAYRRGLVAAESSG
jgi:hypothetical protein